MIGAAIRAAALGFALLRDSAAQRSPNAPPRISAIQCGASARATDSPTLTWRGSTVQWAEWRVTLGARDVSSRVVVVRFDQNAVDLSLDLARDGDGIAPWTLDRAPTDALLALNAGQFTDAGPWGWVVHRTREWQAAGTGTLAGAVVVDSVGRLSVIDADEIPSLERSRGARIAEAVQSYPTLLNARGMAPALVCTPRATGTDAASVRRGASAAGATPTGEGSATLDRTHRDTRLAIGTLADGTVIVAMSRYAGAGTMAERLPIGPTTPEMAEIMRRLGATRALMLDGGLSAQLLVRERAGEPAVQWRGLRGVPLALVAKLRSAP